MPCIHTVYDRTFVVFPDEIPYVQQYSTIKYTVYTNTIQYTVYIVYVCGSGRPYLPRNFLLPLLLMTNHAEVLDRTTGFES